LDLFDLAAYDYLLPEELIAQNPAEPRDSSRLMVLSRDRGEVLHGTFGSLGDFLDEGDLLVLNDTRVIPARLFGSKTRGGGRVEILLLRALDAAFLEWEALVKPGRKNPPGTRISLADGTEVIIGARCEEGVRNVAFPEGTAVLPPLNESGRPLFLRILPHPRLPARRTRQFSPEETVRRQPRRQACISPPGCSENSSGKGASAWAGLLSMWGSAPSVR